MRKVLSKEFLLEFVSLLALVITVGLAWLGSLLNFPSEAVISASVGIAVATYIWAMKWEFKRELQDKLDLYTLLENIEDDDLHKRGQSAINKCKAELENLSKGILHLESGQLFRYLVQITQSAKRHIRTTHIGLDDKYIEILETAGEKQWYQQNVNLVEQGVTFERLFILSRDIAIDTNTGKLKSSIQKVIDRQKQDKIKVLVVWQEEIDTPELIQDFVIVDNKVVLVTNPAWSGGYSNIIVYRRSLDVERYIEIFEALRSNEHAVLN